VTSRAAFATLARAGRLLRLARRRPAVLDDHFASGHDDRGRNHDIDARDHDHLRVSGRTDRRPDVHDPVTA
jgi:hypothetical protein